MNPPSQVFLRRFPLSRAVGLACALAGSVHAWEHRALPPALPFDGGKSNASAEDFRRFVFPDERSALAERQHEFRAAHLRAVIAVFPVRLGSAVDTECAVNLARALPRAGICHACGVIRPVAFVASRPDATEKSLWELAREFRDYVRKNPTGADYALYAEYVLGDAPPEYRALHLILCDARGEWVIVDRQDFSAPDLKEIRPASKTEADALVVRRLQSILADSAADATRRDRARGPRLPVAGAPLKSYQP